LSPPFSNQGVHLSDEPAATLEQPLEVDAVADPAAGLAPIRRCKLPNNMEIAYQSQAEVTFFYNDIFEKQIYVQHGITLKDGDCIFDIGANIGLFTLFAHHQCRNIRVYAFEPAPPLFEILRVNTSRFGVNAKLFNCGLSNETKTATFTFYPNSSGMSSFYADEKEEKETLHAIMLNQLQKGVAGMERIMRHADDLLDERFKSQTFHCKLRTISDIIAEQQIERIDLMKIDVQKSELDVLNGLREEDWPKVRQLVIEVHDIEGRLAHTKDLLERRGYHVVVEQDDHYENSMLYNLFATSAPESAIPILETARAKQLDEASLKQFHERAKKQEEALLHRREQLKALRKESI
jgi:FkbM family methyltransferase